MSSQQRLHDLLVTAPAASEMSVRDLAEKAGLSHGSIANYLAGRIPAIMSDTTLEKLSRGFGIPFPRIKRAYLADRGLALAAPEEPTIDPQERVIEAIKADPNLLPEAREHFLNQYKLLLRIQAPPAAPQDNDDRSADLALRRQTRAKAAKKQPSSRQPRQG